MHLQALHSSPEPLCHWRYADHQRRWATACRHRITRTGEDDLFAFCPYCGRRLLMDRSDPLLRMPTVRL